MVHVSGARSRIQSSASLSHLRTINAGVDESDVLGAGFRVLRTAWCVVRGAWCVVRTAYCGCKKHAFPLLVFDFIWLSASAHITTPNPHAY
jgi:hypothetical protein